MKYANDMKCPNAVFVPGHYNWINVLEKIMSDSYGLLDKTERCNEDILKN